MDPMTTTLSGTCLPKNAPQYSFARPHGTLSHWTFGSWFSKNKKARNKFSSEFSLKCLLFLCHCVSSFSWILLNSHCLSFSKRFGGLFQVKQDRDAAALRLQWFFMISGKKTDPAHDLRVCWFVGFWASKISPCQPKTSFQTSNRPWIWGPAFFWTEK